LNGNGKVVKQMNVRGHWSKAIRVLDNIKDRFAVCYEASCGYGALYDKLRGRAKRVVVAHPGQLRLIFRSKRKNDRVDAKKLAMLLFLDQVPPVYVPSVSVRCWRSFIEFRHRLVAKRTRVKNGLRSLLRGHGIVQPAGRRLWTLKYRSWLGEVELPDEVAALQRDVLIEELGTLDAQIRRVEQKLNSLGNPHPGVILLRTIPGVGPRTAEAVVSYIDDPSRFGRNKNIGAYFGLVPCQDQSAGPARFGHITQEGPATVRKLLTEAAWQGIRRSKQIRQYFERVQRGDPGRKKIALIATAHYLARVMLAMLTTHETWRENRKELQVA
jgi:transposase